jgi:putative redox protein
MNLKALMEQHVRTARAAQPEQCLERYRGETRQVEGLRSEARFGKFTFAIDEPAGFGGSDTMANPAEVLLAALGASIEVTTRVYAAYLGIPLQSVAVELAGNLDIRGFFDTDPAVRSGFDQIEAKVRIESSASDADVARLLAKVDRCCPVLETLRNGTPLRLERA